MQLLVVVALLGLAGWFSWSFWKVNRNSVPMIYFYDLSEQKLFAAPQDAVPPIAGLDGEEQDAVRAIVYSPSGDCERDKQIAYLERYSPELKAQFERAKGDPNADFARMSRGAAQGHTFVRRVNETAWHPMNTEEAGLIVGEWRTANTSRDPIICLP